MPFWASKKEKDPVCGMDVDMKKAAATVEHQGKAYYFCSSSCRDNFAKDPKKYLQTSSGGPGVTMEHH